jgi:hypothetical protein
MMRCKNDSAAKYSGEEPSPKGHGYCAHAEKDGARRKGKDGRMWVAAADRNGRLAWRVAVKAPIDARRERCIRDFGFYAKPTSTPGGQAVMFGARVDRNDGKTWLQTADDHDGEPRLVPLGFVRRPMTREHVMAVYCKPSVDVAGLWQSGALEWRHWIAASRRHWLTIADLVRLNNKKIVVLSMHRNVGDRSADEGVNPRGKAIPPMRFFREAKSTFAPFAGGGGGGIGGALTIADMDDEAIDIGPDVEYEPDRWQPLVDGELQTKRMFFFERSVHWQQLPRKTHVGFRGPMMLWSDVAKMPRVYFV